MSDQGWDLDFTGTTTADVDKENGMIPDGWYRFKLASVTDDNESGDKVLEFEIVHGVMSRRKFKEWLKNARFQDTASKIDMAKKRANCYATRMGVVDSSADGKTVTVNFSKAVGKEFIGHMTTRKGKDGGKDFQGINFDIYTSGHANLKADVYAMVGLVAPAHAPKGPATPAASTPADKVPMAPPPSSKELAEKMGW